MIQKNLCAKIDIKEYIDNINISFNTKADLKNYVTIGNREKLCGMALALRDEGLISCSQYITLIMCEEINRREGSRWKNFLRGICFWLQD